MDGTAVTVAAASMREAANAMAQVARALGETAQGLVAAAEPPVTRGSGTSSRPGRPKRTPLSIPGGLYGSQPEVASHLLRVPDVLFVVDGYNVAKTAWPDHDLAGQRERLLDALEDLVRRSGVRFHVVFDGADVVAPSTGRRLLHVRFSAPGVIADDVIRDLVDELPPDQAVVVVTSDNAVQASVRAMGANTVASAQFLAAIGR